MRKEYSGNAATTTLSGAITNVATTFTTTSSTNWPTGAVGPFVVSITTGGVVEKILCSARAGNVFTVQTRGYDGTVAAAHSSGDSVKHVVDADSINEANMVVNGLVSQGLTSALPASGVFIGDQYWATDTNTTYRWDGSIWVPSASFRVLATSATAESADQTNYPMGNSRMLATNAAQPSWATATVGTAINGTVVTFRNSSNAAYSWQQFHANNGQVFYRTGNGDNTWAAWTEQATRQWALGEFQQSDRIFVPASQMTGFGGAGTGSVIGVGSSYTPPYISLSATAISGGAFAIMYPENWATYDVYFWHTRMAAGTGNIVFDTTRQTVVHGTTLAGATTTNVTVAIAGVNSVRRTSVLTGQGTPAYGELQWFNARRVGDDAADTYASEIYLIGVEFVRAS